MSFSCSAASTIYCRRQEKRSVRRQSGFKDIFSFKSASNHRGESSALREGCLRDSSHFAHCCYNHCYYSYHSCNSKDITSSLHQHPSQSATQSLLFYHTDIEDLIFSSLKHFCAVHSCLGKSNPPSGISGENINSVLSYRDVVFSSLETHFKSNDLKDSTKS